MVPQNRRRTIKLGLIITFLAYPLLTYRTWGMSSLPAQFGIISAYGRQEIFETGTLPEPVRGPTWIGSLRDNALHDPLNVIFSAQLNIITGTTGIKESLWINQILPWYYLVFIPLFAFFFVRLASDHTESSLRTLDGAILAAYVLFPMASRPLIAFRGFNARSTIALTLFHLVLILLLLDATGTRRIDRRRILIYGVVLVGLFPSHHTWAYYTLVIIGAVGVVAILQDDQLMRRYALYGVFIWVCSVTYIATNQILETGRLLVIFSGQLENIHAVFRPASNAAVASEYLAPMPTIWTPLQVVNGFVIVLLFLIFGGLLGRRLINRVVGPVDVGFGSIYLAQLGVTGGLFVWSGLGGIRSRIFEVSIPISRFLLAYLLVTLRPSRLKRGVRVLAAVAIVLCLISVAIYPDSHSTQISTTEAAGIETIGSYTPADHAVFSDYRLGPAFMLYGPTEVYTVDSRQMSVSETEMFLDNVYYQGDEPARSVDTAVEKSEYTMYLTTRQTEVGILDVSLTQFRPADSEIDTHWDRSTRSNRIYSNGDGIGYHRQNSED